MKRYGNVAGRSFSSWHLLPISGHGRPLLRRSATLYLRKQSPAKLEISDLVSQLEQIEDQLEDSPENGPERGRLRLKSQSLDSMLQNQQRDLSSIEAASELHGKLLKELGSDSLVSTAQDKFYAVKDTISAIWNQELAIVGESPLTVRKVVIAILLLLIGIMASRAISRFLGSQVLRRLDIDPSASATIQSLFFYTFLLLFTLFSLKVVNVPLTALTVLGGALALGVGFW